MSGGRERHGVKAGDPQAMPGPYRGVFGKDQYCAPRRRSWRSAQCQQAPRQAKGQPCPLDTAVAPHGRCPEAVHCGHAFPAKHLYWLPDDPG
jgi:hypothetical protein